MGGPTRQESAVNRPNNVADEIRVVPRVQTLTPEQERFVQKAIDIIYFGSLYLTCAALVLWFLRRWIK